jgi:hypothetical protein
MEHRAIRHVGMPVLAALAAFSLAAMVLLDGCAQRAPRQEALSQPPLSEARSRQLVAEWQRQLTAYIDIAGGGDPAVLARLPSLRATGTLRPARISFGALDVEASVAEKDGFDVQGLLLGSLPDDGTTPQVFVVGILQRQGYRPRDIVDIRLVAMTQRTGRPDFAVADGDSLALARYRAALDHSVPLRFPADQDRFELQPCAATLCVEEHTSGARWSLAPRGTALSAVAP